MLMKLTPLVNFINILWVAFLPIFFHLKTKKSDCNGRKNFAKHNRKKSCLKNVGEIDAFFRKLLGLPRSMLEGGKSPRLSGTALSVMIPAM
jgi:hypothetical protein